MNKIVTIFLVLTWFHAQASWRKVTELPKVSYLNYISDDLIIAANDSAIFWGDAHDAHGWQHRSIDLRSQLANNDLYFHFLDLDLGFVLITDDNDNSTLFKLQDTAQRISFVTTFASTEDSFFHKGNSIAFFNRSVGIITTKNSYHITRDGGDTWTSFDLPVNTEIIDEHRFKYDLRPLTMNLYADGRGTITGLNGIMITRDLGATWSTYFTIGHSNVGTYEYPDIVLPYLQPYDVLFYQDKVYILSSYSFFAPMVNECYQLDESTLKLIPVVGNDHSQENFKGTFDGAIFFGPEDIQFVNFSERGGSLKEYRNGIFRITDDHMQPTFKYLARSSENSFYRFSYPLDYSNDYKNCAFITPTGELYVSDRSYCDKLELIGFEDDEHSMEGESFVKILLQNNTGDHIHYPGAWVTRYENDSLIEVFNAQNYVVENGNGFILADRVGNFDGTKQHDVLIWAALGKQYCNYTYDPKVHTPGNKVTSNKVGKEAYTLELFPNPAKELLQVSSGEKTFQQLQIMDVQGRVLRTERGHTRIRSITVSDLLPGYYLLILSDEQGNSSFGGFLVE